MNVNGDGRAEGEREGLPLIFDGTRDRSRLAAGRFIALALIMQMNN